MKEQVKMYHLVQYKGAVEHAKKYGSYGGSSFDEKQLKTEQHWMYWRKETYGLRTPKRFKITNYGPAIEGKTFEL